MNQKGEILDKGSGAIDRLTRSAHYKTLAFCLVCSIIGNCWQSYSNSKLQDQYIKTTTEMSEKRVQEIKSMVDQEVERKIYPIKTGVEAATRKVDTIIEKIGNEVN